jgi:hypothetical protein
LPATLPSLTIRRGRDLAGSSTTPLISPRLLPPALRRLCLAGVAVPADVLAQAFRCPLLASIDFQQCALDLSGSLPQAKALADVVLASPRALFPNDPDTLMAFARHLFAQPSFRSLAMQRNAATTCVDCSAPNCKCVATTAAANRSQPPPYTQAASDLADQAMGCLFHSANSIAPFHDGFITASASTLGSEMRRVFPPTCQSLVPHQPQPTEGDDSSISASTSPSLEAERQTVSDQPRFEAAAAGDWSSSRERRRQRQARIAALRPATVPQPSFGIDWTSVNNACIAVHSSEELSPKAHSKPQPTPQTAAHPGSRRAAPASTAPPEAKRSNIYPLGTLNRS